MQKRDIMTSGLSNLQPDLTLSAALLPPPSHSTTSSVQVEHDSGQEESGRISSSPSRSEKVGPLPASSALQHAIGKSKLGSILPEQITTNFITGTKVQELDPIDLEKGKQDTNVESDKESVLRKRRNITNKNTNDAYNLPTADKLIKPTGAYEHAGKTTSKNVMSKHAVNLRFYTLNLGTDAGQLVYSLAMIILPMIPLLILIGQLGSSLVHYQAAEQDLVVLRQEVLDALDIAKLVQQLQEERAAVALNKFLWNKDKGSSWDQAESQGFIASLANITSADLNIEDLNKALNLSTRFAATDIALEGVHSWPEKLEFDEESWPGEFFKSKLSFQIKHGVFRSNLKTGEKTIFEVLKWYDYINSFILDYIAYSIHVSEVGGFYWYIIALQDLLRATEYTGASGVYAIRYYVNGKLSADNHRSYCILDSLQEEYLHQTYNSMPDMTEKLNIIIMDTDIQWNIYNDSRAEVTRNQPTTPNITKAVKQFEAMFMYTSALRKILNEMADNIKVLVDEETEAINYRSKWPIVMLICLMISVPVIVYLSSKASYSMRQSSRIFDEQAEDLNYEKRKTDGLLQQLLPVDIIAKLKSGEQPSPRMYESTTLFFGDICGFTKLTAMSTASQTIKFLNDLYNIFDNAIDVFDVYKVEIVGDGYLVASGLPYPNGKQHAKEIANMAIRLMKEVDGFRVNHMRNYKMQMRMGIHSGSCVGGVVGSKMPHFSVFGDTVNIAALMESTSEPMRIQISHTTMELLEELGGFNCAVRGQMVVPRIGEVTTYWLLDRPVAEPKQTQA